MRFNPKPLCFTFAGAALLLYRPGKTCVRVSDVRVLTPKTSLRCFAGAAFLLDRAERRGRRGEARGAPRPRGGHLHRGGRLRLGGQEESGRQGADGDVIPVQEDAHQAGGVQLQR